MGERGTKVVVKFVEEALVEDGDARSEMTDNRVQFALVQTIRYTEGILIKQHIKLNAW